MLKNFFPILFVINGCAEVVIPNVEWCVSIGSSGAICQNSNNDQKRRLDLDGWLNFLEANESKGPALCTSSEDFTKLKTSIEQLCLLAGDKCTYDRKFLDRVYEFASNPESSHP